MAEAGRRCVPQLGCDAAPQPPVGSSPHYDPNIIRFQPSGQGGDTGRRTSWSRCPQRRNGPCGVVRSPTRRSSSSGTTRSIRSVEGRAQASISPQRTPFVIASPRSHQGQPSVGSDDLASDARCRRRRQELDESAISSSVAYGLDSAVLRESRASSRTSASWVLSESIQPPATMLTVMLRDVA
jgi:hypothetical protein